MRDYLLVALGINYKNPKEALKKDEMLFNETQKDLLDTFKQKNIQDLIKKSSQEYSQIEELAKKPFEKKNSKEYLFLAEKAFDAANAVVQAIGKTLNQKSSDLWMNVIILTSLQRVKFCKILAHYMQIIQEFMP